MLDQNDRALGLLQSSATRHYSKQTRSILLSLFRDEVAYACLRAHPIAGSIVVLALTAGCLAVQLTT